MKCSFGVHIPACVHHTCVCVFLFLQSKNNSTMLAYGGNKTFVFHKASFGVNTETFVNISLQCSSRVEQLVQRNILKEYNVSLQ